MVRAVKTAGYPANWPTDGRDGGVPDPTTVGPTMMQIGNEGGLMPQVAAIDNQPVNYDYNRRSIVVLNVTTKGLFMGPAERADVVIDFSQFKGKTVILYQDAPAPVPGFDPRLDYYTGNPDFLDTGGADTTLPGYAPNTRTVMQFRVDGNGTAVPFNLAGLKTALPTAYQTGPGPAHRPAAAISWPWAGGPTYARIQDTSMTFTPVASININGVTHPAGTQLTMQMQPKSIIENFDDYGRMNALLGTEIPFTNILNQTSIPFKYIDPPTEVITPGDTQIWKITHNGVDTHSMHTHLTNWQVINRVGWDGAITPPNPNELGWKETVRMNPLEDIIVAARYRLPGTPPDPVLPFAVSHSNRLLDPTTPPGGTGWQFTQVDPTTGNPVVPPTTNVNFDYGWEYVWHCHLLGHEENDMMHALVVR